MRVAVRMGFAIAILIFGNLKAQAQSSGGGGRDLVQSACSGCHDLNRVTQAKKSAAQWEETVTNMIRLGAPVLEGERQALVQFLAANYGSGGPGSVASAVPTGGPQVAGEDARGREIVLQACSTCHGVDYPFSARRSPSEWEATVDDMIGRGAPLLEGERALLLRFLAKYYGPEKPKTNINSASAQELMSTFGLSQAETDAVARYKQQHGAILGWEDLRKVPNLDVKKFESKRDILAFL